MRADRVLAWAVLIAALVFVWLFVQLQAGCTCVVNEARPAAHETDGGLVVVELDDAG